MPLRHSAGFEYRLFRTQGSAANAASPGATGYHPLKRVPNSARLQLANTSPNSDLSGLIYIALDIMLFPLRMVTVVVLALVLVPLVVILAISVVISFLFESRFLYLPGRFRKFIKFCRLAA